MAQPIINLQLECSSMYYIYSLNRGKPLTYSLKGKTSSKFSVET